MQAHQQMVFYLSIVESTVNRVTRHIYLDFALIYDLGFKMMSIVKAPKQLNFISFFKTFQKNYIPICAAVRFLSTKAMLLKVIETRPNIKMG